MGLDMYAFVTEEPVAAAVDFETENATELYYWRKHPNLHGWMHRLYIAKGGSDPDFDLASVVLGLEDLDRLEADIKAKNLPPTTGFFFGSSDGTETEDDLEFIAKAREAIADGDTVYYSAWW